MVRRVTEEGTKIEDCLYYISDFPEAWRIILMWPVEWIPPHSLCYYIWRCKWSRWIRFQGVMNLIIISGIWFKEVLYTWKLKLEVKLCHKWFGADLKISRPLMEFKTTEDSPYCWQRRVWKIDEEGEIIRPWWWRLEVKSEGRLLKTSEIEDSCI